MTNFNVNIEAVNGVGTVVEIDGNKEYVTTNIPMQLISMDGVAVGYKRVDVDNFDGRVTFGRVYPIAEIHDETSTSELVYFKAINNQEFYSEIDKLVEKRFQNRRKEFVEKTVRRYSENHMLSALDRCLFNFDKKRYQVETEQFDSELIEFFDSLFEN